MERSLVKMKLSQAKKLVEASSSVPIVGNWDTEKPVTSVLLMAPKKASKIMVSHIVSFNIHTLFLISLSLFLDCRKYKSRKNVTKQ